MKNNKLSDAEGITAAPTERPAWLNDELEVIAVLHYFIDKIDKQPASERVRMPSYKLNEKKAPKLYNHDEVSDRTWNLIQSLSGLVFDIRLNQKRSPYDADYVGASLLMTSNAEEICRTWLSRPFKSSYQDQWVLAIDTYSNVFDDSGASLKTRPVKVSGKSPEAVVAAFAKISEYLNNKLTLRQLSARCFWGHSKTLDTREDLLYQLYRNLKVTPRPVLVHIYMPKKFSGVLFIENQDTYIQASMGIPTEVRDLAVVFVSGFRGSAERVRSRKGVSLHYQDFCDESLRSKFEDWWFEEINPIWPVWFWGDLDYSGMAILKSLRNRFGDIQAWPEGYEPMLNVLKKGGGHSPEIADKVEQVDPCETGCLYADHELLPSIRFHCRFIDQEIV